MSVRDNFQTLSISIGKGYRQTRRSVWSGMTALTGYSAYVPTRLVIAPQDLRTADASIAEEYYRGRYTLGGSLVNTTGKSPFLIEQTTEAWQIELHEFGWLRHLSEDGGRLSASHARSILKDWIELQSRLPKDIVWDVTTTSKRLISWLCHSILMLSTDDQDFQRMFLRAIGGHVRFLKRHVVNAGEGLPKLLAYIAMSYASVCYEGQNGLLKAAREKLGSELDKQFPPHGGHVSRNPQTVMDILALLLPLREGCIAIGIEPGNELLSAIDRMFQSLRVYHLSNGSLARFNGAGITEYDLLVTLLRYDENLSGKPLNMNDSGYERLHRGEAVIVMDAGSPPRGELSTKSHAGCLSFEFTAAGESLVVNTGVPPIAQQTADGLWRTTAAHSTAVFCETSSCKFESSRGNGLLLGGQILNSQIKALSNRNSTGESEEVVALHHGYVREFGAVHHRALTLDASGGRLEGIDWFTNPDENELSHITRDAVTLHFHIHPDVTVEYADLKNTCLLTTRGRRQWLFRCDNVNPQIEDSIFFANLAGPRKTSQITLAFSAMENSQVQWVFKEV